MQSLVVNETIEYVLLLLLRVCWDSDRLLASPAADYTHYCRTLTLTSSLLQACGNRAVLQEYSLSPQPHTC